MTERVRASFLHSPKKLTGTAAKELSKLKTTVWRVLHKGLVFKPYRIQMVQQLSDEDYRRRFESRWSFPGKGAVQWRSDIARQRCSKSSQCQEYGDLKTHMLMWSIDVTLLKSMCFVRSPVKKFTVHSSLLKKPSLAWHVWTCCNCGQCHSYKTITTNCTQYCLTGVFLPFVQVKFLICLVCIVVVILCVFAVLCVHCWFFYFRCRTAG